MWKSRRRSERYYPTESEKRDMEEIRNKILQRLAKYSWEPAIGMVH